MASTLTSMKTFPLKQQAEIEMDLSQLITLGLCGPVPLLVSNMVFGVE